MGLLKAVFASMQEVVDSFRSLARTAREIDTGLREQLGLPPVETAALEHKPKTSKKK